MPESSAVTPSSSGSPREIRRVAMLFAGGPAPAANAVISTAAAAFHRQGIEVLGIMHGYAQLVEFGDDHPMQEGRDYIVLDQTKLRRTRNTRGIMIGTSRTNPGKDVSQPSHLSDPQRTAQLAHGPSGLDLPGSRCPGLDRRRRHAQDGQQVQAVPGVAAARDQADRGGPRPQDDRQRLPRDRLHVRLFHGRRDPGRRDPQPPGRRRGGPDVLPRRDDGPQRRLAGVWRRHRRRGQPGHQHRGPRRRPDDRGTHDRPQDGQDHDPQDHEHR